MSDVSKDIMGIDGYGDPDGEDLQPMTYAVMEGIVLDRVDPKGLGRVRARVNTFFEQGSGWLYPMLQSGGSPGHGRFNPPRYGAVVRILFPQGDLSVPGYYICGGWGRKQDIPDGALVEGNRTRAVEEDDKFLWVVDDRDSNDAWFVKHKSSGYYFGMFENGRFVAQTNDGLLGIAATEPIPHGSVLETHLSALKVQLDLIKVQILALGGALPTDAPTVPANLNSTKWKVE